MFQKIRRFLHLIQLLHRDPRTPFSWKALVWGAVLYGVLPFDLWWDFLPIIGLVDDVSVITILLYIAFRLVPEPLLRQHRDSIQKAHPLDKK